MDGELRYRPADSFETPRFSGVRTFMRLPYNHDLANADAAVVGAPFDTGATFRAGGGSDRGYGRPLTYTTTLGQSYSL